MKQGINQFFCLPLSVKATAGCFEIKCNRESYIVLDLFGIKLFRFELKSRSNWEPSLPAVLFLKVSQILLLILKLTARARSKKKKFSYLFFDVSFIHTLAPHPKSIFAHFALE